MWIIPILFVALVAVVVNEGVHVKTSTEVKIGGKKLRLWKRKEKK